MGVKATALEYCTERGSAKLESPVRIDINSIPVLIELESGIDLLTISELLVLLNDKPRGISRELRFSDDGGRDLFTAGETPDRVAIQILSQQSVALKLRRPKSAKIVSEVVIG